MRAQLDLLKLPGFLIGLAILLFNDFILKAEFGNLLTGKLSDFAGLFIFPIFWVALFPKHKTTIYCTVAIFFIFWKSPYSQPVIDSWNAITGLNYSRVVDYTDLLALLMLPLSYQYISKTPTFKLQLHPIFPLLLAAFAFLATSVDDYSGDPYCALQVDEHFEIPQSREEIVDKISALDSVFIAQGIPLQDSLSDVLFIEYFSGHCNAFVGGTIELSVITANSSNIHFVCATHCISEGRRIPEIVSDFEREVVDKL